MKIFFPRKYKKIEAFTLIELSVVILIISILLFGTMSSSTVINTVKNRVTRDRMEIIYRSLGNFLYQNRRLPCPASINLAKTNQDYGKEVRDYSTSECSGSGVYNSNQAGAVNLVYGMIPTKDLNISADFAEDGFGNKISFYIDKRFTKNYISNISNDLSLSVPSFGTAQSKDLMYIKNRVSNGEVPINNDAVIVLISHGANAFGAFKNNGFQNIVSGDEQEFSNIATDLNGANANFDRVFYSSSEMSNTFDDILIFKTRDDFVEVFDLMSIIPCKGNEITDEDFNKASVYYGQQIQAFNPCPMPNESIKKIKKCDSFGRWIDIIRRCPNSTLLTCTIPAVSDTGKNGMKQKIVNANTQGSDGECESDYSGNYSWSCSASGQGSFVNNCVAYCNFLTTDGVGIAPMLAPPGHQGEGSCTSYYNGYYLWSCSSAGIKTVIQNNCIAN